MSFFQALFENSLLQTALFAGLLASFASGVVGTYVVVKRIVFISGSISHSVLAGMGFCLWLSRTQDITWLTPFHGAIASAVGSALLLGWIHMRYREREDSVIAAIWAIGMAIGVLFISLTPGFNVEITSFLIGNILFVTQQDLWTLAALNAIIFALVIPLHRRFEALCFDEEQATLQGQKVRRMYLTLLVLIALSVVILIQVVGIFLVMAMLTIAPAIANQFTSRLPRIMALAGVLNVLFVVTGSAAAYYLDWSVGATIALIAGTEYLLCLLCFPSK